MLDDLLSGRLYPTGLRFRRCEGYPGDSGVLIVPGRYWAGREDEISEAVAGYEWLLMFVTSDEEALFGEIDHPNMIRWVQTPRHGRDYGDARLFGVGYSPHTRNLPMTAPVKDGVFLSGQDTHQRRHDCFDSLEGLKDSVVHRTAGFIQGLDPTEYMRYMAAAKIAPCPSGAVSVDSFRVWEALEAGALPVVDTVSPVDGLTDYWVRLFGDVPFPVVADWAQVDWGALLNAWPANTVEVQTWWRQQKRRWALKLRDDLQELGAQF